ncbi:MAG: hypothetical protein M1825_003339 [Sarcosagium campestre]|nr:MAG: hypothetical protein M1825_003339 [Sarcosagium campestre]
MSVKPIAACPGLPTFLKSLKTNIVESSVEHLISLLKRRQIRNSRPCAIATAHLLLRVVSAFKWNDVGQLLGRIQLVGQRLCAAQPREMAVGNIVRRVLGLIREEAEDDRDADFGNSSDAGTDSQTSSPRRTDGAGFSAQRPVPSSSMSTFSPLRHGALEPTDINAFDASAASAPRPHLLTSHTSYNVNTSGPAITSMFSLLTHEATPSTSNASSGAQSPVGRGPPTSTHQISAIGAVNTRELKPEIIGGIEEIIDELNQVDDQIAAYALEHIHSNEVILTHSSSTTVQKFLLKAAAKRKFTVVHAESFPNDHEATHAMIGGHGHKAGNDNDDDEDLGMESFQKLLTAAGITVIVIPDSAVFALMARVNKVILGTHAVLANGGLVAAAGARTIAKAARVHRTPVVIVSGVYKLSPVYPFDFESLIEYGDTSKIFNYEDGDLVEKVDVENPLFDYVPAELVDLYITNLGGHAPSYLYRIVSDHYRVEDINL